MAKRTLTERCWAKIQRTEAGCWEWTGSRRNGYGAVSVCAGTGRVLTHATSNR